MINQQSNSVEQSISSEAEYFYRYSWQLRHFI